MVLQRFFYERLTTACDNSPDVPPYGKGRQTVIAKMLKISPEAARKYFLPPDKGGNTPVPAHMSKLATFLDVDEAWLSLGVTPSMTVKEKKEFSSVANGAVYIAFGLAMSSGSTCAFAEEDDIPDFYAIKRGVQKAMKVVLGVEKSKGNYEFDLPVEYNDVHCIAMIERSQYCFDILSFDHDLVEKHGTNTGGVVRVTMHKEGKRYFTGRDEWSRYSMND